MIMFPIALDLSKINILLIGKGSAFKRRYNQLMEYGAEHISLFEGAGFEAQIAGHDARVVMIAGLAYEQAKTLADAARTAGKLVNVEDINELCDFYFTASVRRGDLVISVSTGGASPTLARRVRDYIAGIFSTEWEGRTKEIAEFRDNLKKQGKTVQHVLEASDSFLQEKQWLDCHSERREESLQRSLTYVRDDSMELEK